jgi:1,5-anhydro-D-fructose reductase (1,5-anhydro-D-mannitol-forming)
LCEKPFGLHAAEAQEMAEYCRKRNVLLYTGFVMRFHHLHKRMQEIVQSNALGRIVNIYANFSCWYPDNGSWRQKKESSGGGVLMDMAVHSLDIIRFITGDSFSNINALTRTRAFHYEVDDSASLLLELTCGGTCSVNSYFCIPDEAAVSRIEIYGTRGVLKADHTLNQEQTGVLTGLILTDEGKTRIDESADMNQNIYTKEFEGFCDAVEGIVSDIADADEMVYIQRIVQAAYESSETGKRIHLR